MHILPLKILSYFLTIVYLTISIIQTVLSYDPVAMYFPLGENTTLSTVTKKY